jgi:hypothetical protein
MAFFLIIVNLEVVQLWHQLIFLAEIFTILVLCLAPKNPEHNKLQKVTASSDSEILLSVRVFAL